MSRKSSPMIRLIAMLGVGAVVTLGVAFLVMTLGAADDGVDMSGSDYSDEYDSITEISIISLILSKFLPIIIGVCALLIAVVGIKKYIGI